MSNSELSKGVGTEFGFAERHIGLNSDDLKGVLGALGCDSLDQLIDRVVPTKIRLRRPLDLPAAKSETEVLAIVREIASRNQLAKSYIGLGYSGSITPPVIQRNILENPNWYTAYTPYQPEIAQGRLEALLNFQTMISDLTGLEIANASLLDEGTAAAEAMALCFSVRPPSSSNRYFVSDGCHPQTISVVQTRAEPLGIEVLVQNPETWDLSSKPFGALLQYPTTTGKIEDYRGLIRNLHDAGTKVAVAADLLSLTLLMPPGEFGADICVGTSQRFGVPMGFGGPHAAFFATRNELKRHMPGRLVGVSKDTAGRVALRLALQTREQHIRRDRATSNICTAQVLLAVIASSYAVYHGPKRLRRMAEQIHINTEILALGLERLGFNLLTGPYFDTLTVDLGTSRDAILERAKQEKINFRHFQDGRIGISLDETTTDRDLQGLLDLFCEGDRLFVDDLAPEISSNIPADLRRRSSFLGHPVFNSYHTETELLRYLHRLEQKDLSLTTSMIPLGSCTMKL
ncbi:MAG: glycine dehydrogenase (aminomethyl-transferring), partial [Verrucomicrobia bacterium]|nr:glycine dehydrogenase (aminomethyl-transferring) [Verrucomicrobiota bacterium]